MRIGKDIDSFFSVGSDQGMKVDYDVFRECFKLQMIVKGGGIKKFIVYVHRVLIIVLTKLMRSKPSMRFQ